MKDFMRQMVSLLTLTGLGTTTVASAGLREDIVNCIKNPDGSGYCYGNLLAFRNHASPSTYAEFREDTRSKGFHAAFTLSSTEPIRYVFCTPNAVVEALWNKAMSHDGFFHIVWDSTGTCNYLELHHGSRWSNF